MTDSREASADPSEDVFRYVGTELDLFRQAAQWKAYFGGHLRRHIAGEVLEVGAGLGGTTAALSGGHLNGWMCLEPDARLAARLAAEVKHGRLPASVEIVIGTISSLPSDQQFDTVLYVDTLEHIETDRQELRNAALRLRPGGALIVLAPAHNFLFSEFDRAVGHFRRYSRKGLRAIAPSVVREDSLYYLDSVGMLASLANRLLLRKSRPSLRQILFWDRYLVRVSRWLDPLILHRVGKSVVGVWKRTPG